MYANNEDRLRYAAAHYQANKSRYNPARQHRRRLLSKAATRVPGFVELVFAISDQRFIYPDELYKICEEEYAHEFGPDTAAFFNAAFGAGRLPDEAKKFGLFLRRPPFAYHPKESLKTTYLRQLSLIPKSKRAVRAEALILQLVSKDLKHGR